jgi:hypothetical protein
MVPERFSSAKRRMVSIGIKKRRTTAMLYVSGRRIFSVALWLCPICGCMAARIETSAYWMKAGAKTKAAMKWKNVATA